VMGDVMNWLKPGGAALIDEEIVATVIFNPASSDRRQTQTDKGRRNTIKTERQSERQKSKKWN